MSAPVPGKQLRLIQFKGPIQPAWVEELRQSGLQIVDYIPENTYLVYGDGAAVQRMQSRATGKSNVRWEGKYRGVDKIHPLARGEAAQKNEARSLEPDLYAIQLVLDPATNKETLARIEALAVEPIRRQQAVAHYYNVIVRLPADSIPGLSEQPDVISIWPYITPQKRDERQGMIVAGQLSGNVPTGPGYLQWLAGKGFTQEQFDASGLVVDVTDSGVDNGLTNDVRHFALFRQGTTNDVARLRYARLEGSPSTGSSIKGLDGHGNINAHIIAGYVGMTNFPHTDSSGYRYGLGIAPFVKVGSSVIFDPATFTDPNYNNLASRAYRDGARISGNSWGADTAGGYNSDAQNYDFLVRDAQPASSAVPVAGNQQLCFVFAAGNAGSGTQTVGSPGTAKNVITVGAAENVHPFGGADGCGTTDTEASSANDIVGFSSRGPCADQRKKPDIMAPGTHVTGGVAQNVRTMAGTGTALTGYNGEGVCGGVNSIYFPSSGQQFYTASSGTSHSTPAVAGGAALVYQWFLNNGRGAPSPAMIKSFLMNSARYMSGTGANDTLYSNNQGMGMMNLETAFDGTARLMRDQLTEDVFTASGQTRTWTGSITTTGKPLRITLAWTDAPGSTSGNAFRNNLDLTVTVNGQLYRGNVFSGANSTTGGSADVRNNVESVFLPAGVSGPVTITVTTADINSDGVPNFGTTLDQDFALVAYNFAEVSAPSIIADGASLLSEDCPTGALDPGELATASFGLRNVGTLNASDVTARLLDTNGITAVTTNPVSYGALTAGGTGVSKNFEFISSGVCGSTVTAVLEVKDGTNNLGTVPFSFVLGTSTESTTVFSNTSAITIADNTSATPYPSSISVAGLPGKVVKATVTLRGFSHTYPADVDIILVSPSGQKVSLMSGAGGGTDAVNADLTFDDAAGGVIGSTVFTGTYQPSGIADSLPSPAPASPYAGALGELVGASPNGTWSLYVADRFSVDTGSISRGWSLSLTSGEPVCCGDEVAPVITSPLSAAGVVGQFFSYQITSTGVPVSFAATGLPAGLSINTSNGLISGTLLSAGTSNVTISATNGSGQTGSAVLTISVSGGGGGGSTNGVIAGWDVSTQTNWGDSPMAPTQFMTNFVQVEGLTRSAAVGKSGTAAARAWGGSGWSNSATFAFFSVTPAAGQRMSVTNINVFDYRRSSTGPSSGEIQFSTNGTNFTTITNVSYPATTSGGGSIGSVNLGSVSGLQSVAPGTTVTFRIVNSNGTAGTWYVFDRVNSPALDLAISGSFEPDVTLLPLIQTNGQLAALAATYGQASSLPGSLTVAGGNISGGILVTAPSGFEVSQTPGGASGYASNQLIAGSGTIAPVTIYVRLAAGFPAGSYEGELIFTSAGAAQVSAAIPASAIDPAALSIAASDQLKPFGQILALGPGQTAFSASGLVGAETIGSVTLEATGGTGMYDLSGIYEIIPSAATGGSFISSNYNITYVPGTLTVDGDSAPQADPDLDGLSNLFEEFMGLNPIVFDSDGAVSVGVLGGELFMDYRKSKTPGATTGAVRRKMDLQSDVPWSSLDVVDSFLSDQGAYEMRRATVPVLPDDDWKFLRLVVEQQ